MGKALREFVTVRYEEGHDAATPVIEKFHIQGFPTLLVLGPDGEEWDEVGPREPQAFVDDLARIRRGEDTLPTLRAKVRDDPADTEAALRLTGSLANRYPDECVALCTRVFAALKPEDTATRAKVLVTQGYAESNRERNEAALALFDRVLTEFPTSGSAEDAALSATNVLPEVPPERGLAFIAKALEVVRGEAREYLEYTRGYLHLRAAEDAWLKRGQEAGDDAEELNSVAWECFQRGWHLAEATAWARKAVELGDGAPHILDTLANLLFKQGEVDEAIRLEEQALAKLDDAGEREPFEENLAMWKAARSLRQERAAREGK